jgi:beta-xylosidase
MTTHTLTYTNPVFSGYLADPCAWEHDGVYYAIGTGGEPLGVRPGQRIFPLLRSLDFARWEPAGAALVPPDPALGTDFWAPEIAFSENTFYLYYSVGSGDKGHQLRVATSTNPLGPYHDTGTPLQPPGTTPFAIDPHPFQDDDGQWYLFYAHDFLDSDNDARPGTALAVDRLDGMTRLAGDERTVLRGRHDWQRFMADRPMYEGVYDWHTLEGPFVVKHEGRYYCFYSGGRWDSDHYGVDYAVSDHVLGPYRDDNDGNGARVLRTVTGRVEGPGHNSLVRGPDGQSEYVVYHAWDPARTARRMCLDRLVWTPDGPRVPGGPTWTPQPVPTR